MAYYRTYNCLWEDIGHNAIRCIASYRERMVGVITYNPNLNKPSVLKVNDKDKAICELEEDAYWDNALVYKYRN